MSRHLRLKNISYNFNPYRGKKYNDDAVDLNDDGANLVPPDDNRKYEIINTRSTFEVWFTDATGKLIVPDNFVLFLKLEY